MKLRTKFSLLTCTLTIIVVLGVSVFLYIAEKQLLIEEINENQKNVISGLLEVSKESLITSNQILVINYLNKIKDTRGVLFAMLTTAKGDIKAHTDINQLGKKIEEPLIITDDMVNNSVMGSYVNKKSESVIINSSPVIIKSKNRGLVWVAFSQAVLNSIVDETLKKTRKRIVGVAGIGLIIGFLGAVVLSSMMIKPIKKMVQGAESIGSGKLDTVIEVTSKDELGSLARDLNKMASKLSELDQMKQDFISSITHEFRTPLNAMGIHFDLLFKGRLGEINEKQKESLEVLKNNASRLGMFIDDLLDIAKLEKGKMAVNMTEFNLTEVIKEIASFYKVQADQKDIVLNIELEEALPDVKADPDRTRQVLTNLLNNAIKFTGEKGRITIGARLNVENAIDIYIKDTGMGIPEDQIGGIFNKFEQVKGIRSEVVGQKGTGLGLAIVKGLVENQGGKIWVESEVSKGTVFYFTVPVNKSI